MKNSVFTPGFIHPQFLAVERIIREIEKQIKLLEIKELNAQREYLEQMTRYNKALLKLRELELTQGVTPTAEERRRQRIRSLMMKLRTTPRPTEPDLTEIASLRSQLDSRLRESMQANTALLATEALRNGHFN